MQIDILSYQESFLNPLLKLLVPILLIIGLYYLYRARQKYGGELKRIADLLIICGVAGVLSSTFRFLGDFIVLWKWGESILILVFALICLIVSYLILQLFKNIELSE